MGSNVGGQLITLGPINPLRCCLSNLQPLKNQLLRFRAETLENLDRILLTGSPQIIQRFQLQLLMENRCFLSPEPGNPCHRQDDVRNFPTQLFQLRQTARFNQNLGFINQRFADAGNRIETARRIGENPSNRLSQILDRLRTIAIRTNTKRILTSKLKKVRHLLEKARDFPVIHF